MGSEPREILLDDKHPGDSRHNVKGLKKDSIAQDQERGPELLKMLLGL
jgi:hypothetical protein